MGSAGLPNRERAQVPAAKLIDYLLSETHPVGRSKARFFRGFGYGETNSELLERDLKSVAESGETEQTVSSLHGTKYVIRGLLKTPSGKTVEVRTVWILESGQDHPRFVTAYPTGRERPEE